MILSLNKYNLNFDIQKFVFECAFIVLTISWLPDSQKLTVEESNYSKPYFVTNARNLLRHVLAKISTIRDTSIRNAECSMTQEIFLLGYSVYDGFKDIWLLRLSIAVGNIKHSKNTQVINLQISKPFTRLPI